MLRSKSKVKNNSSLLRDNPITGNTLNRRDTLEVSLLCNRSFATSDYFFTNFVEKEGVSDNLNSNIAYILKMGGKEIKMETDSYIGKNIKLINDGHLESKENGQRLIDIIGHYASITENTIEDGMVAKFRVARAIDGTI